MERDTFLSPEEALKVGLIDRVLERRTPPTSATPAPSS